MRDERIMAHREFPFTDPSALLEYARYQAAGEIGDFVNGWAGLIDGAFSRMRRTDSQYDREIYREVALVGIEGARSHTSMMPESLWIDKNISVRVTYLRTKEKDEEWTR